MATKVIVHTPDRLDDFRRGRAICVTRVENTLAPGLPRAWHGTDDFFSAFLAAVGYVIRLATRNQDADFHQRFASGALRRMGLKARLGFL